jgi:hypothetical protein
MGWRVVSYARALSYPRHARVLVFGMLAYMFPWMYVTLLSVVCRATHVRCIALLTHACAYSLEDNSIGDGGAQYIAAALAHNSTLQTLK